MRVGRSIRREIWPLTVPPFNILTATVPELIGLLDTGNITTVEIVSHYRAQIKDHNHRGLKLKAVISIVPKHLLLKQAEILDHERESGQLRGPLHGIPFLAKVSSEFSSVGFDRKFIDSNQAPGQYVDSIDVRGLLILRNSGIEGNYGYR